nr:hypothetical protein [Deinococcus arboris]
MPEAISHHLGRHAPANEQDGCGVPQIVEADAEHARLFNQRLGMVKMAALCVVPRRCSEDEVDGAGRSFGSMF